MVSPLATLMPAVDSAAMTDPNSRTLKASISNDDNMNLDLLIIPAPKFLKVNVESLFQSTRVIQILD
jgi:hypothetical protein